MARTRESLINAGLRLAERTGLAGLSVNLIVGEAGVAKGTFFHHFGDRASYLLALHREFHERLAVQVQAAIDGMPPGRDRLTAIANTYSTAAYATAASGPCCWRHARSRRSPTRSLAATTPAPSCAEPTSSH